MTSVRNTDESLLGSALVNAADAFPNLERLRDDFDIIYFLDLCVGLEAAILYDSLHVTAVGPGAGAILEPLANAGVLVNAKIVAEDPIEKTEEIMSRPRVLGLMERVNSVKYIESADAGLAATALVAAMGLPLDLAIEEDTGRTLILPFRQEPIYLTIPSVKRQRNELYGFKLTLAERYSELSDTILSFRHENAVHDLDRLALPPLAVETLASADTFDELGERVVEQRERS